jgi:small subunit ribosomal protein S20
MPNTKSAAKRMRSSAKCRAGNRAVKGRIATLRNSLLEAIAGGEQEKSRELYRRYCSSLDKAVKRGTIKARAASRRKSRAAVRLNRPTPAAG